MSDSGESSGTGTGGTQSTGRQHSRPDWDALGRRWWSHVETLASDAMEGRDTGSPGYDRAADYVTEHFRAVGLEPAGTDGFRQRMDYHVARIDEPHSSLQLVHGDRPVPVVLGEDAALGLSYASVDNVDAEAMFVGYGLRIPELKYDDLGETDLHGKIAVFVTGGPADLPGPIKSHYQSLDERRRAMRQAGVLGTISIPNPKALEIPWPRVAKFRFMPRMDLVDLGPMGSPPLPFSAVFNTDRAEMLFSASGHTLAELLPLINDGRRLPRFPLNLRIRAHVAKQVTKVTSQNLAGILPGSDPSLRNEYVVISAHLDHVGIGEPVNGDPIYSGAMDNASGVASLIEVAHSIVESGKRPRRSLLFLAVTGEEKGLLGSEYYATHPTVKGRIVADVNMDMYNPLFPLRYLEVQGLDESSMGEDIRAVAKAAGVEVQPDQEPEHNRFIRSDQYSFIKTGVPALTFKFSYLPGTPEEKVFKDWLTVRYHAPLDDLEQPVDRAAAAQFDALLETLALRIANADQRPTWNSDSFFRRFAQ